MNHRSYTHLVAYLLMFIAGCTKKPVATTEPIVHKETDQNTQNLFNFSQLTKGQEDAAAKFKTCKNRDKFKYWKVLIGAFPHPKPDPKTVFGVPTFRMTKAQVIKYIGSPDSTVMKDDMESLHYEFGVHDGIERTAFVHIRNGFVWWFGDSYGTASNRNNP